MVITLLGTGTSQGIPVVGCTCDVCLSPYSKDKRWRTSAYIEMNDVSLLIDAGPDLRQQLLQNKITKVDAILLSHEHKDHLGGLDDIRPIYFLQGKPIPIYAQTRVLEVVKKDYDYAFQKKPYSGVPSFELHPIENHPFTIKNVEIIPIQVMHAQLPILGYRINNVAYITDASFITDVAKGKLKDLDLLIINALRPRVHHSHFSLPQSLALIEELHPKEAVLTHVSHEIGLWSDCSKQLPKNVRLGYDGLRLIVN